MIAHIISRKHEYRILAAIYALSLSLSFFLAWFSESNIPKGAGYRADWNRYCDRHPVLFGFHRFDFEYYQDIAEHGYSYQGDVCKPTNIKFFPIYPLLIRTFSYAGPSSEMAGLVCSNLAALAGILLLFELLSTFLSARASISAIILMLSFPSAFFLHAPYSESIYLLLFALAGLCWQKGKTAQAALYCGILSATRLPGVTLPISFAIDALLSGFGTGRKSALARAGILAGSGAAGILLFDLYLRLRTGSSVFLFKAIMECQYSAHVCKRLTDYFPALWNVLTHRSDFLSPHGINALTTMTTAVATAAIIFVPGVPGWLKISGILYSIVVYRLGCGFLPGAYRFSLLNLSFPVLGAMILSHGFGRRVSGILMKSAIILIFAIHLVLRMHATVMFSSGRWNYF